MHKATVLVSNAAKEELILILTYSSVLVVVYCIPTEPLKLEHISSIG